MNWSVEQQRLLGAMGYQLLVRVDPSMARGRLTAATLVTSATPRSTTASAAPPASATVASAASMQGSQAVFPALRAALTRAAAGADIAALLPDLDVLRRQASAKRALWPRLRSLRRTQ